MIVAVVLLILKLTAVVGDCTLCGLALASPRRSGTNLMLRLRLAFAKYRRLRMSLQSTITYDCLVLENRAYARKN